MRKKKFFLIALIAVVIVGLLSGCTQSAESSNTKTAMQSSSAIVENQPAPTDLSYSLERYNVIKRAYWVNGQREKAVSLPCMIQRPLGYIILFSDSGAVVGRFIVDGKVSSLNSYLFPAEYPQYVASNSAHYYYDLVEIAGIDGCYGKNASGIFFFTTDGKYVEWAGDYLYSDIPFEIEDPIVKVGKIN